jgi:hypothetical protein
VDTQQFKTEHFFVSIEAPKLRTVKWQGPLILNWDNGPSRQDLAKSPVLLNPFSAAEVHLEHPRDEDYLWRVTGIARRASGQITVAPATSPSFPFSLHFGGVKGCWESRGRLEEKQDGRIIIKQPALSPLFHTQYCSTEHINQTYAARKRSSKLDEKLKV